MKKELSKKWLGTALAGIMLTMPAMVMADDAAKNAESAKSEKAEAAKPAKSSASLEKYENKISYSMGYEMGSYLKSIGAEIEEADLIAGVKDAFSGAEPALTPEEMTKVKQEFAKRMQEKQEKQVAEMKAKNLAAGKEYLEKNKAKKGVTVTKSGLQYEVIQEGKGDKATAEDTVSVKYKGSLIDGKVFDSTEKQGGKPAEFKVNQVIAGWTEALQLMNPGTKLRLVIPSELAYGERGAAPMIEPNSVLVFDVELLEIKKADKKSDKPEGVEQKKLSDEELQKAAEEVKEAADKVKEAADKAEEAAEEAVKK